MTMRRGALARLLLAILAIATLGLAACSSDDDGDTGAAPDDTAGSTSDMDPNGVLKLGYDLNQSGRIVGIDPITVGENTTGNDPLYYLIFGRFLRPLNDGTSEPDLAESVTIVDPTTIEVVLKPDLTFSDGSPFDATAVKTSLDAVLANEEVNTSGYQALFFSLDSVDVVDPTTVRLNFPDGKAPSWFDTYGATWATSIVKDPGSAPTNPIGAGPYKVASFKPGESLVLEANPNYWNADAVKIPKIEVVSVPFQQAQVGIAALQSGQVDTTFTEPALLSSLTGNLEAYQRTSPSQGVGIHMCKAEGPLADERVRLAINKGIDREGISEAVYFGTASPQHQMWPEGHRLFFPELDDELAYDPEAAKQLVADAGYAPGEIKLDIYPIQAFNLDETAEVMQAQLKEIGIELTIVPTTDYVGQFLNANVRGMGLYPNNAIGTAKLAAWTGSTLANVCKWNDPELEQIVSDLSGVSQSTDEARELWEQASEIVLPEALSGFVVWRNQIAGYNTNRLGDYEPLGLGNYMVPDPFVTYVKKG